MIHYTPIHIIYNTFQLYMHLCKSMLDIYRYAYVWLCQIWCVHWSGTHTHKQHYTPVEMNPYQLIIMSIGSFTSTGKEINWIDKEQRKK